MKFVCGNNYIIYMAYRPILNKGGDKNKQKGLTCLYKRKQFVITKIHYSIQ
jgi:hypothetical protein